MLVLAREVGQSVFLDDVRLDVLGVSEDDVEISLVKISGEEPVLVTLNRNETVPICYNVEVTHVVTTESTARIGFEAPCEVSIQRGENWDPGRPNH